MLYMYYTYDWTLRLHVWYVCTAYVRVFVCCVCMYVRYVRRCVYVMCVGTLCMHVYVCMYVMCAALRMYVFMCCTYAMRV